ncbi:hypothetical protein CBFG_00997 [Clostridiales bacterium 1_7_47FAA]|nr:hypothetical protein CBFG_00997 [Clostridiales bacterium 1_7_47FAA]
MKARSGLGARSCGAWDCVRRNHMWEKEQVLAEFQKRGKRITQQRRMLLDVILEGNWTNCKDIYYEARKRDPNLGMATVYRTVSALEEMGVLARTFQYSSPKEEEDCQQQSYASY